VHCGVDAADKCGAHWRRDDPRRSKESTHQLEGSLRVPSEIDAIDVYWRPGCGVCQRVKWDLRRLGVPARWHNIWEDEAARRLVRKAAGGNETVPTIVIGHETLVAPSRPQLAKTLRARVPHLVAERKRQAWPLPRIAQWLTIAGLVTASELTARAGHTPASYAIDAGAVGAYLLFRRLLRPGASDAPSSER